MNALMDDEGARGARLIARTIMLQLNKQATDLRDQDAGKEEFKMRLSQQIRKQVNDKSIQAKEQLQIK